MEANVNRRDVLLALGAYTLVTGGPASAQDAQKLRVVGPPVDGYKSVYYGIKSGLFRKYGLEVEATIVNSGAAAAAALAGRSAEVAFTNSLTVFQAHTRGVPMQFVAPCILLTSDRPTTQTVALKTFSVKSGRDLNGKTIGSSSVKDINAAATLAWIDSTGGDAKSVKLIEVPASAATAFLEEGRADAITLNEPTVSQVLASGKARVIAKPYEAIGKRLEVAGYAAMRPFIEKNADVMTRFARAMRESQAYTNSHMAETVDIVAGYTGIAPDVVAHSVRMVDPEYLDVKNLQPLIDVLAKYGFLDAPFNAAEVISSVAVKPSR
jgi:NitT/TauT family transport system substrate-binding protein